jgi:hypothetical protein
MGDAVLLHAAADPYSLTARFRPGAGSFRSARFSKNVDSYPISRHGVLYSAGCAPASGGDRRDIRPRIRADQLLSQSR